VIIPEEPELSEPTSPRPSKRRQSLPSDSSSKRARLSTDSRSKSPSTVRASPQASPPPAPQNQPTQDNSNELRKSVIQEERKRGRRLFGGLLGTLSQTAPNNQLKRRQEIEKRQVERVKAQKAEDDTRRAERLQKLKEVRRNEQVKFDRESVCSSWYLPSEICTNKSRCGYDTTTCWRWQISCIQRQNREW
jgi:hypothetical protein